jgi:hypothetical protein
MPKGFSIPLLLIVVVFLFTPIAYFSISGGLIDIRSWFTDDSVKGVTTRVPDRGPGLSVTITSSNSWDLVQYLCTSLEECSGSAMSGKRWATLSGGHAESQEVVINTSFGWEEYQYLKFYVKSGWSSELRGFNVLDQGYIEGTTLKTFENGSGNLDVVIVPLSEIRNKFVRSAVFSDQ